MTHAPLQDVSSVEQPALAPPVDAPPTLAPAWPVLAPACPALAPASPELSELPPLGAPELPTLPALPVVPALALLMPPAVPALPDVEPAAPAEPPSDVVLLEQPSNERHAPQAKLRNHHEIETNSVRGAISFSNSKFEFKHGIGV